MRATILLYVIILTKAHEGCSQYDGQGVYCGLSTASKEFLIVTTHSTENCAFHFIRIQYVCLFQLFGIHSNFYLRNTAPAIGSKTSRNTVTSKLNMFAYLSLFTNNPTTSPIYACIFICNAIVFISLPEGSIATGILPTPNTPLSSLPVGSIYVFILTYVMSHLLSTETLGIHRHLLFIFSLRIVKPIFQQNTKLLASGYFSVT